MIVANGQIYEKPVNKTIQLENLRKFVAEHTDIYAKTAVVVFIPAGETYQMLSHLESTKLQLDFANLTDGFLQLYVDSEEGLNAAGGFQIQGKGGLLFSKIDGDYSNVVGLPFASTFRLIERAVYNQE